MKKKAALVLVIVCVLGLCGCSKGEPHVVKTFEATPEELIEEYVNDSKEVTAVTYYEMSDGTWKLEDNDYTYKYKLVITGRLNNAAADITYVILSNIEDITFEQAWKASGLSSDTKDYFKAEEAVFVGSRVE